MSRKVSFYNYDVKRIRKNYEHFYQEKFFQIFCNKFKFNGDIDYQEIEFILKKFWFEGKIASFKFADKNVNVIGYAPFSIELYNYINYPTAVHLINIRGFSFIPAKRLIVDKDVIIGYIRKDHLSVFNIIQPLLKRIVDIEMVINTNLIGMKLPRLVAISPEDKTNALSVVNKMLNDEPVIFEDFKTLETIQDFVNSSPYIVDKLYSYKQDLEDEILSLIGVKNVGKVEKAERVNVEETESNDEEIYIQKDSYVSAMNDFFERTNKLFGSNISVDNAYIEKDETLDNKEEKESKNE